MLKQCHCARADQGSSPELQKWKKEETSPDSWLTNWAPRILNNTALMKGRKTESPSITHYGNTMFAVIMDIKEGKRRKNQMIS